jgi:hypothetical protein
VHSFLILAFLKLKFLHQHLLHKCFFIKNCNQLKKKDKEREQAIFCIVTRLPRCGAWNGSQVTSLVIVPIIWNIQIFLCNLQSFWMPRALLSATAAQWRRNHTESTLPDVNFCSTSGHLGSSWNSSSYIPAPQTRQAEKK